MLACAHAAHPQHEMMDPAIFDLSTPSMEAVLDARAAVELASRLRELADVALMPTMIFDQPTPRALPAVRLTHACAVAGVCCAAMWS